MRSQFMHDEEEDWAEAPAAPSQKLTRGGLIGLVMAAGVLVYGLLNGDIPVLFLALAFILFMARPFLALLAGGYGAALSNVLKGFSLTLFLVAILLTFS